MSHLEHSEVQTRTVHRLMEMDGRYGDREYHAASVKTLDERRREMRLAELSLKFGDNNRRYDTPHREGSACGGGYHHGPTSFSVESCRSPQANTDVPYGPPPPEDYGNAHNTPSRVRQSPPHRGDSAGQCYSTTSHPPAAMENRVQERDRRIQTGLAMRQCHAIDQDYSTYSQRSLAERRKEQV